MAEAPVHVVFVEEDEGADDATGEPRLLGTFSARLAVDAWTVSERLANVRVDKAIAWGRARAGIVLVRFGRRTGEYWSAGATPHWSYPPWPPPDLPPLRPRPVPEDGWQRRPADAPVLVWTVTVWLVPDDLGDDARESLARWDEAVSGAAAACRAGWDRQRLDEYLADLDRGRLDAGERESFGFSTTSSPAYRIYLLEETSTAAEAERRAGRRCAPPAGFRARLFARPTDLGAISPSGERGS